MYRRVVPDDLESIRNLMRDLIGRPDVDVVVATGGTGFSPRDVSVEAVSPLFARSIDGFGELFRMLSYEQIESAAMLSRACAGVADDTVIFVVPGSPKAVRLALERLILPEIGHLVGQIRRAGTAS